MTQPRTIPLSNLVVFGDSMSDLGIMNETYLGMAAKAMGKMVTNETGRYSDGRNWVDFLYQWVGSGDPLVTLDVTATKQKSLKYQSLTADSVIAASNTVQGGPLVRFVDYAKGGAVAASDVAAKGGALSHLSAQCDQYLAERKKMGTAFTGATLHIIWIGLNDIVTCERSDTEKGPELVYDALKSDVASLEPLNEQYPAHERTPLLAEHNPAYVIGQALRDTPKGEGVLYMIADIVGLCNRIVEAFPDNNHEQHFMFLSLPDPNVAPRILTRKSKGEIAIVKQFTTMTNRFNKILRSVATAGWKDTESGVLPGNCSFVPIYEQLRYIATHPTEFGLRSRAQDKVLTVKYGGADEDTDEMAAARNFFTTTDAGHPTEAVYRLLALYVAEIMIGRNYGLGRLNPSRYPQDKAHY